MKGVEHPPKEPHMPPAAMSHHTELHTGIADKLDPVDRILNSVIFFYFLTIIFIQFIMSIQFEFVFHRKITVMVYPIMTDTLLNVTPCLNVNT